MHTVKKWDDVEKIVDSSFAEAMEYMALPILGVLKNHKMAPVGIDVIAAETDYNKEDILGIAKYLSAQDKIEILQPAGAAAAIEVKLTPKGLKSL